MTSSNKPKQGGVETHRGILFQDYSLLFYLLVRRLEYPDIEVVFEPGNGEDATFMYTLYQEGKTQKVTELVQCKKREFGKFSLDDLRNWIEPERESPPVELLGEVHTFYTALVFGELGNKVKKFVPEGLPVVSAFRWDRTAFFDAFPLTYLHPNDPSTQHHNFGTPDIRRKIRVLRMLSLDELDLQCERLLRSTEYKISEYKSTEIVRRLLNIIVMRSIAKEEQNRRVTWRDIESVLEEGRAAVRGAWQEARAILDVDNRRPADVNREDVLRAIDFEQGRFARHDEFEEAWKTLQRDKYVVVCGPAGIGKTTLALYLAYRFLQHDQNRVAYYLSITAAQPLSQEIAFLEHHIMSDTLFIVDDQYVAVEEVEALVTFFWSRFSLGQARARLIVTSTITYGRKLAPAVGKDRSELNRATVIRKSYLDQAAVAAITKELRLRSGLDTPLSDEELASLSGGIIGLALILARCARDFQYQFSSRRLFQQHELQTILRNWVMNQLNAPSDSDFFFQEVLPAFIVASFELPIPATFGSAVERLHQAGLFEVQRSDGIRTTYKPASTIFSILLRRQYPQGQAEALSTYLTTYPKCLPAICDRLSEEHGRPLLKHLCREHYATILETLIDPAEPLSLNEMSKVLSAVRLVDRDKSRDLLLDMGARRPESSNTFFSKFLRREHVRNVTSLTNFLNTILSSDRHRIRQLARAQLGETEATFILKHLFEDELCSLDQAAACLSALSRCSREFALQLNKIWQESPDFHDKIAEADAKPEGLYTWLRFCEYLKTFNRLDSLHHLALHLPASKVARTMLDQKDLTRISDFLLRLRRLHPRLAADIITLLYQNDPDLLERSLRRVHNLDFFSNDLVAISRLNKRLAINTAYAVLDRVQALVRNEGNYAKIGLALDRFNRINPRLAYAAATSIQQKPILAGLRQENIKFNLVGKFLFSLGAVAPDLADAFKRELNYDVYLHKIREWRLTNWVYLVRGFLTFLTDERRKYLLGTFLNDRVLIAELNHSWREANGITEVAFCLSFLLDIPLKRETILQLLDIDEEELERTVLQLCAKEESQLHIAQGLYAIAKFDLYTGVSGLNQYMNRLEAASQAALEQENWRHRLRGRDHRIRYLPDDLVELGILLRLAAAIDPAQGQKLADLINLPRIMGKTPDETNLGRLSVFILGLSEASRKLALQFLDHTTQQHIWLRQLQESDDLENIMHYAHAIRHVNHKKASEYGYFLLENYQEEVKAELELEANLMMIANWLKLLANLREDTIYEHVQGVEHIIRTTAEYDMRFRHLLEMTEALIECGRFDLAREFSEKVIAESSQVLRVRQLHSFIVILHKTLKIGHYLDMPTFTADVFAGFDKSHFLPMFEGESQAVLCAYAYHLLNSIAERDLLEISLSKQDQLYALEEARSERRGLCRSLALILAQAPLTQIEECSSLLDDHQLWERGLAAVVFKEVFPNTENPFLGPTEFFAPDVLDALHEQLNEHIGNLQFGLILQFGKMKRFPPELLNQFQNMITSRADNEGVTAIQKLLRSESDATDFSRNPYYMWMYIKNTVLRPTYFAWEGDIEKSMNSFAFKQKYAQDIRQYFLDENTTSS